MKTAVMTKQGFTTIFTQSRPVLNRANQLAFSFFQTATLLIRIAAQHQHALLPLSSDMVLAIMPNPEASE